MVTNLICNCLCIFLKKISLKTVYFGLDPLVFHSSLHRHSLGSIPLEASFLLSRKHAPFRCESSVLLNPSGGHNCLTIFRLQMFLKSQVCLEYWNRTREHQSGHQSSYWLRASVLNFSDLTRTGCHTLSTPPHKSTFYVRGFYGS